MPLISTFELLVKDQLPKEFPAPAPFDKLARTVVQGYFLTLANPGNTEVTVSLVFTAVTPTVDINSTLALLDVTGTNLKSNLSPDTVPGKARFTITLPAQDTALFILQPDIIKDGGKLLRDGNFEVRGFAEVTLSSLSRATRNVRLLITPEHRSTFFNTKMVTDPSAEPRLDQCAYALPTATGSSLFALSREGDG